MSFSSVWARARHPRCQELWNRFSRHKVTAVWILGNLEEIMGFWVKLDTPCAAGARRRPRDKEREWQREREGGTETETYTKREWDRERETERLANSKTVPVERGWMPWLQSPKNAFPTLSYQSDATHVRMLIFKDRKKCKKVDSKSIVNRPIQFPNKHRACFFRILKNRCVKRPRLLSTCPPPYIPFAKSDYNPNNKQTTTDGTDFAICFGVCAVRTGVKSASRKNLLLQASQLLHPSEARDFLLFLY